MITEQLVHDHQLVQAYIKGNESAIATLLNRHKRKIFSYIVVTVKDRDLAEDIFQDTFFKVITTLKRGEYNEEGKFLPWVMRIAHNLIIDHFRRESKLPTVSAVTNNDDEEVSIFDLIRATEYTREEEIMTSQMKKGLRKLVEQLPAEQREVLMMRHYYDMSFKEIAEQTNVSINTALGRMRYALINLKKMIEQSRILEAA